MSPTQPSPSGIWKFCGVTSIEAGAGAAACGAGAEELQAARASAAKTINGKGFIESLQANASASLRLAKARRASSPKRGEDEQILDLAKRRFPESKISPTLPRMSVFFAAPEHAEP